MIETGPEAEILVVDDERVSRRTLARLLQGFGFVCREVGSGAEALRLIESSLPALLLLDYAMPGLNGAEICEIVRAHADGAIAQLPIIMLTGMSGEEQEVLCLQAGASDFVTKPVHGAVLKARIGTQLRLRALRQQLEAQNRELAAWRTELERDLEAARLTQQTIIPQRLPTLEGWDMAAHYQPVIQVGGDIYDWFGLPDGRHFFWIADATGHGASAALLTALAKLLFRHAAAQSTSPAEILRAVNEEFHANFRGRLLLTAMGVALDPRNGKLEVAGAGHPPLLITRAIGGLTAVLSQCPPLGLQRHLAAREDSLSLAPGEGFFLFTDGFYDMISPGGERMDFDGFEQLVRETRRSDTSAAGFLAALVQRLGMFSGRDSFADDLAAMAVFRPAGMA
jgi:sigma-B regulation protein RsbU (phosphoserine phosphatase)